MQAIVYTTYGSPDVLQLNDVEKPMSKDNEVLVKVHAASANPADWHLMRAEPFLARLENGLLKPKNTKLGADVAGRIEAVGRNVTQFHVGDDVFGGMTLNELGSFAEYVCVPEELLALKPAKMTFEQAAAVPLAAFTALQGLRNKGQIQPGQKVLINGTSGGVGTFAVQIAKSFGAEVTGVCSTRNVDMVRSVGADHVIDYTQADFTRSEHRYDLMLDIGGGRSWSDCKRVLSPNARVVLVGGPKPNRLTGVSLSHLVRTRLASLGRGRKVVLFLAKLNKEDLGVLRELLVAGNVTPVIDRRYELSEVPDALRYLGEGHSRAKNVITV